MKGSNPGTVPKNPKQNEGIESGRDAEEPETKRRDQIRARCQRNQNKMKESNSSAMSENPNKTKGLNPSTMPKNPKQKEGIESGHDGVELETKRKDQIWARCWRT